MQKSENISIHNPLIIWRLIDGKPGHENQSLGLVNELSRIVDCQHYDISVSNNIEALINLFSSTYPSASGLPLPDLIIGAGHRTHLHLLAARKAFGGKVVVLMQPSLPVSWFDLCVIPQHDKYRGAGEYIETRGVLNSVNSEGVHLDQKSLIMVGGPSKHYKWDTSDLIAQIYQLVKQNPKIDYTLTTSRRTPKNFISAVKRIHFSNLKIVQYENTEKGWVAQKLSESAYAWITEDSVSMVYEGLTANVAVGLLNMSESQESRVSRGIKHLVDQSVVVRFDHLGNYKKSLHRASGFSEANRCSNWIIHHWMRSRTIKNPALITQFVY